MQKMQIKAQHESWPSGSSLLVGGILKRPWLLTQLGQRVSMQLSVLASVLLLLPLWVQIGLVEAPRAQMPQLNPAQLQSCDLEDCLELLGHRGLRPVNVAITEGSTINMVSVRFENLGRLTGSRTLWLELRDADGNWLEAASTELTIGKNGPIEAEFGFTHPKNILETGILRLRY
jgi:hypothetical protein